MLSAEDKVEILIKRYDKKTVELYKPYRDLRSERYTVSQGELYEYRFIISQLTRALNGSINDYVLITSLEEIISKEEQRESSFKASAQSDYTVAPDHEGRTRACFKIIQDLKGILPKYKKSGLAPITQNLTRQIVVCGR